MKQDEPRRGRTDGTIQVPTKEGVDKIPITPIGMVVSENQAQIYRCFEEKDF